MPAILIKHTVTSTVTISSATQDPALFVRIAGTGVVDTGTSDTAIYGTNEYAWMVRNHGTVSGGRGVDLRGGGTVINAGSIYGSSDGIYARYSSGGDYLTVINRAGASITTGSNGNARAIEAANGLSLLNAGTIGGGYGCTFGIYAHGPTAITNGAGGTIVGGYYGIAVNNTGADLAITNKGSIGSGRDGLLFEGGNSGGTVVNSGTITGGWYGVYGCNDAVAPLIVNSGSIGGVKAGIALKEGILLRNSGTITSTQSTNYGVTKSDSTVYAYSGSVKNSGLITGGAHGVVFKSGTGTVINTGSIHGDYSGVRGQNGLSLVNSGTIDSSSTGNAGVYVQNAAVIDNKAGGFIYGYRYGLRVVYGTASTISNEGTISSGINGADGIFYEGSASGTLNNSGVISGRIGVWGTDQMPVIVNSGSIYGYSDGVHGCNNAFTLTNLYGGSIISGEGSALYARGAGMVVTNYGLISGHDADSSSGDSDGVGIYNFTGDATITNAAGGVIAGYHWGVYTRSPASLPTTVSNHGTIDGGDGAVHFGDADGNVFQVFRGAAEFGVVKGGTGQDTLELGASGNKTGVLYGIGPSGQFQGFETLEVDAGARWKLTGGNFLPGKGSLIVGAGATLTVAGKLLGRGDLTVQNSGYIDSPHRNGVDAHKRAFVTNNAGATIYGYRNGIIGRNGVSLTNAGSIIGGYDGIYSFGKTSITNQATGTIHGHRYALQIYNAGAPTVVNYGLLSADGDAVLFEGSDSGGKLINFGTIDGGSSGINAQSDMPLVVNYGLITGYSEGVNGCGGAINLINEAGATIVAKEGDAVNSNGSASRVTNYGTIDGQDTDSSSGNLDGVGVYAHSGGVFTNAAPGSLIEGYHWGVYAPSSSSDPMTVTNHGEIVGGDGAVHFSDADGNVFQVFRGAAEFGVVQGGAGQDTLELGASGHKRGVLEGLNGGGQFQGFETLEVDAAARWKLTGGNFLPGGGSLIVGAGASLTEAGRLLGQGDLTVQNDGLIASLRGSGVDARKRAFVTNGAGATIYGFKNGIFGGNGVSLSNAGTILSANNGKDGVYSRGFTRVDNQAGGYISGRYYGVHANRSHRATVTNEGSIHGGDGGVFFEGGSSSGTLINFGTISSGRYGVAVNGTVTVANAGSIEGQASAVYNCNSSTPLIVNNLAGGTLTSVDHAAVHSQGSAILSNAGYIYSQHSAGVSAGYNCVSSLGSATVTNFAGGTIASGEGSAIYSYGAFDVTNFGTIDGRDADSSPGNSDGVGVYGKHGGVITNAAGGVIEGYHWGVYVPSGASGTTTITNRGTISGGDGAVHFSDRDGNVFQVYRNAVETGVVLGGAGDDTLELGASGSKIGSISGIGPSGDFVGFENVTLDDGARWQLTGGNELSGSGTLHLGSAGILTVTGITNSDGDLAIDGAGKLVVDGAGSFEVGSGAFAAGGQFYVDAGNSLFASGSLQAGSIVVDGGIAADGSLHLTGSTTGIGTISISAGSLLDIDGRLDVAGVSFLAGGGETLTLGGKVGATVLSGFDTGDTIDLVGVGSLKWVAFAGDFINVVATGRQVGLHFASALTPADFTVTDIGGGTIAIVHT